MRALVALAEVQPDWPTVAIIGICAAAACVIAYINR